MKQLMVIVLTFCVLVLSQSADASIFATELVSHSADLTGSSMYNDPNNLVGQPATRLGPGYISIVEAAWGPNSLVSFGSSSWAVVKFDHLVENDPNNPYGLDFIVYGNSFFAGSGWVTKNTNHHTYTLRNGKAGREPVLVSVSQDGQTWYDYTNGPFGDTAYPTNPWVWDYDLYQDTGCGWTDTPNDFTRPVNPNLTHSDLAGLSTEDAMNLYGGSAGGTAFDLAESGFEWIQYIKVSGIAGTVGEIDAFSDIAPVPVPGAFLLLSCGILTMAGIRRKL